MPCEAGGAKFLTARYRDDPRWRAELRYCHDKGLPHSEFAQWSDLDREKALLVQQEETERCDRCGTYHWQWQDQDGNRLDPGIEADLYRCFGCEEFDTCLHQLGQSPGDHHGMKVRWFPRKPEQE